jgi:membrane-associated phospholipid phosphatase
MPRRLLIHGKTKISGFVRARLDADGLFGRHFSIGTGIVAAIALLFSGLAVHVSSANRLTAFDDHVSHWFNTHGTPGWTQFMFGVTGMHGAIGVPLLSIVLAAWLARIRDWYWFAAVAGTTFGGMLLNIGMKYVFRRGRPSFMDPLVNIATYSFPSGHTAGATVLYSALAAYLMSRTTSIAARWAIALLASAMIVLVGLSRIYLGAHYLSDVLGAVLEGLAWLAICLTAVATVRRCRERNLPG